MVTSLGLVLLFVLIPALQLSSSENNSTRDQGIPDVSKETTQNDFCREVCEPEVLAVLKRNKTGTDPCRGLYNRCSVKRIKPLPKNCPSAEHALEVHSSVRNQSSCSLVCLMNSSPCLMECSCVYDSIVEKKEPVPKNLWYITDVGLHCQDLKLRDLEVTAYISWKIQSAVDFSGELFPSKNIFSVQSPSDSLLEATGTSLWNEENNTSMDPFPVTSPPGQFSVQIWRENSSKWEEVGNTNMTIMKLDHLSPNSSFKVRVQGLDINRSKIGENAVSQWIRTTEAHVKPKMVKNIKVGNMYPAKAKVTNKKNKQEKLEMYEQSQKQEEWKLNVEVLWEPNEDMSCSYNLAWFYASGNGVKSIRPPKAYFQTLLKGFEYSTSYTLGIRTVYPERDEAGNLEGESEEKCIYFTTPSCADVRNQTLEICSPPTPENITYELTLNGDIDGSPLYDLKIMWSLPDYVLQRSGLMTVVVLIPGYEESQKYDYDNATFFHPRANISQMDTLREDELDALKFQVSSDRREMIIPSIVIPTSLIVTIKCESEERSSEASLYIVPPKPLSHEAVIPTIDPGNGIIIGVVIFLTLLVSSLSLLFYVIRRWKKQPTGKKIKYFESTNKKKGTEDDGNEVGGMLYEQPRSGDVDLPEGYPEVEMADEKEVDEFEITLSRLVIRELLGEGAFGVVYKGYYRTSNQDEVFDERSIVNRSGSLWELVAVKMLKENASVEEESQLRHEMETLKYLGKSSHPNVVSLIGCHTRKVKNKKVALSSLMASDISVIDFSTSKPLLLLIVEHCALGDLQRFLQKVWRESLTSDNVKDHKNIDDLRDEFDKVMKNCEIRYINEMTDQNLNGHTLKYATLDHSSSSKEDIDVKCSPIIVSNRSYGVAPGLNDDKLVSDEVIDAKKLTPANLLSYARQIVMGMEFLAGHKVVHRDLAARNVLICGDGCTVKISDFGMSRDVYLQNVYHKASAQGKLPIKWMAPEALLHRIYTTHSDVWSFGILLWEIITLGGTPYPGIEINEVFKLIQTGYRMERPQNCSPELYQLMNWCWQERPSSRPSFSQLRFQIENLLEKSSASTYLSLPIYSPEMSGVELSCQESSVSNSNDVICRDCERQASGPENQSEDTHHMSDICSNKVYNMESSSDAILRNERIECGTDPDLCQSMVPSTEVENYLTPISASMEY
ncbi:uncharacterized protein LOC124157146 [Ischnura elegans]|uniref:uncharacterized protein LOC124157146 n=1 Tax=Ischnura elegans TaxID=197161 RepID=UPI001ED87FDA|nr:uncharacterized protein LOC124157146 [Ischnura elegans]